jgi:hypothetical protein
LHRLRRGELTGCAERVALHGWNAALFRDEFAAWAPDAVVTDASSTAVTRPDPLARRVASGARGCLLFIRLPVSGARIEQAHRDCLARWASTTGLARVRAGFGWTRTTGRAYGRDPLNTRAGDVFIRISVGLEPAPAIVDLARSLGHAAAEVLAGVDGEEGTMP